MILSHSTSQGKKETQRLRTMRTVRRKNLTGEALGENESGRKEKVEEKNKDKQI